MWGDSRLRISLPPEVAMASSVVGFERAETWVGCRNAKSYQSQERVHGINWVEILSFHAKDDLCLSQARICNGMGYSVLGGNPEADPNILSTKQWCREAHSGSLKQHQNMSTEYATGPPFFSQAQAFRVSPHVSRAWTQTLWTCL